MRSAVAHHFIATIWPEKKPNRGRTELDDPRWTDGASQGLRVSWLPDCYNQILDRMCLGPLGLLDYGSAMLRCKMLSLPFLGLRQGEARGGTILGKEGIKF